MMMIQLFEGTVESGKEHKPPRAMPQLMEYFKAIKVSHVGAPVPSLGLGSKMANCRCCKNKFARLTGGRLLLGNAFLYTGTQIL